MIRYPSARLLVVDDEAAILHAFRRAFREPVFELQTARTGWEAIERIDVHRPDVVVLDLNLPDLSGLEVFRRIRAFDSRIPIIFVTGHGTTGTAIEATKAGAFDYVLKPVDLPHLRELISRALQISRSMRVPALLMDEHAEAEGPADTIVGRSTAMQEVYKAIGRVASQEITVLIHGESGTGKELVARAIYQHSRRANKPFVTINCAAIPETLLESELFGHERGAFTGADRQRIGKFEQCHGGTLFLDEIGDMTPLTQAKILRVLQDQQFERVGGSETIRTDVRILAATNRDLGRLTASGHFRGDLYYRLSVFAIALPPLRERPEDLPLLVEHFVRRYSRDLGKDVREVSAEALDLLASYSWPGNVRELQSIIKQSLLRATGPALLPDFLPALSGPIPATDGLSDATQSRRPKIDDWIAFIEQRLRAGTGQLYGETLAEMERQLLTRVLEETQGNILQSSRILGITRHSLRRKLRALGLRPQVTVRMVDEATGPPDAAS